ncbi:uracil-DNA glycosylase [Citreimonas salinaria]|uniref:Uracil-DNA glycosylase n=1 Tax=Citreimonas salinaria TaxID=321339 RepID=A0A1H3G716_9RHOB|nr:uracil-DNA glycosylase [Citreimonas salinaria]SDX98845.1 Uracil-DNA glycosylase [Citreimonas salinaria]
MAGPSDDPAEAGPIPPDAWRHLSFFERDWYKVCRLLKAETRPVLPPAHQVFDALARNAPDSVRVVILGQDPYPTPGHAHGHAFSVEPSVAPPRSLVNVFTEMENDLGSRPRNGDLRHWADQGVLLLNTALTVPAGMAGGHARLGWEPLTAEILRTLSDRPRAFVLWGRPAQAHGRHISGQDHLILQSAHPSPLSARRGFFGSRPFSRVNDWLKARGETPIDWTGQ